MLILNILWPTFAMVALVFVVWFTMVVQRLGHMKRVPPAATDFASAEASARYFGPVGMPGDNLTNLFEMPVLFFALVPLLMLSGKAGIAQVLLAWIFVVLRCVHSYVHIGPKVVRTRFRVYLASVAVLSAMWIGFFVDMVLAAQAYAHAVRIMGTVALQP